MLMPAMTGKPRHKDLEKTLENLRTRVAKIEASKPPFSRSSPVV